MNVSEIVSIISSLAVLVAVIQLVRETKSQNLSAFFYLHEYLSREELSYARLIVRKHLYKKPYDKWTAEDKEYANKVCSSYDQAGLLMSSNAINKKLSQEFLDSSWGQSVIDQFEALLPYLDDLQTPNQTGKQFFKHFCWLYSKAKTIRNGE